MRDLNAYYQAGKSMQKDLHNILTPSSVPRTGKKDQSVEGWKGREGRRGEQAEHRGLLGSESNMYDNLKCICQNLENEHYQEWTLIETTDLGQQW